MDHGAKIAEGTPGEVKADPVVIRLPGRALMSPRAFASPRGRRPFGRPCGHWSAMNWQFFVEVLVGGLLAGVMYSLVALGFVLIYKASGRVQLRAGRDGVLRRADVRVAGRARAELLARHRGHAGR